MEGSTRNSVWVAGAYVLGEANKTNVIEISHYVNNIDHPHKIYSTIKYVLADAGKSSTYTRPYNTHGNSHKQGHTIFIS